LTDKFSWTASQLEPKINAAVANLPFPATVEQIDSVVAQVLRYVAPHYPIAHEAVRVVGSFGGYDTSHVCVRFKADGATVANMWFLA
jgi:hypothetical protein